MAACLHRVDRSLKLDPGSKSFAFAAFGLVIAGVVVFASGGHLLFLALFSLLPLGGLGCAGAAAAVVVSVRRLWLGALAAVATALALTPLAARPAPHPVGVQLVRFGGHFGSSRGFGLSSRPRINRVNPLGRASGRSRGLLRRIGHALAFAAVLHFLFAGSHGGGFLFLLLILGLVFLLVRRRRRRTYQRY